jgi:hypothetical protein
VFCFDLSMKNFPQMVNHAGFAVTKPSAAASAHAALLCADSLIVRDRRNKSWTRVHR